MKKNNRKIVALFSLLSVLFLSINVTFAWFYMNSDVDVDYGSEIVCETGTSLEVSMYQGIDEETSEEKWSGFSSKVTKSDIAAKLQDITGDGQNLYSAVSLENDANGNLVPSGFAKAKPINEEGFGDYIELQIKLRSANPMNVYFGGESSVTPTYEGDNPDNIYGDFSKDYIAGAMRIAVLEKNEDSSETLKMIWAPNPTYELTRNKNNGTYSFTKNGTIEDYKYYKCSDEVNNTFELYNVNEDDKVNKKFVVGSTNTDDAFINNSPLLTTITPTANDFGYSTLIIRVWFEGTDREADQALSGGQAKMNLVFTGMEAKDGDTTEAQNALDAITVTNKIDEETSQPILNSYDISGVTNGMQYTTDGYNWTTYDEETNNLPNVDSLLASAKEYIYVYFRIPETVSTVDVVRKVEFAYQEEEVSE